MAIRRQKKFSSLGLIPGLRLTLNPFSQELGTARILRNAIPERGRTLRKPFAPRFHTPPSGVTDPVWAIVDFKYTRSNAPETKLLIFRSNGRIYRRIGGGELEIFPGATSFSALAQRPQPTIVGNLLHFADGANGYFYDGRDFHPWGITRQTSAPAVSAVAGSLTAATGLKAAITEVILDEAGNRLYESSRSDKSAFTVLSSQNLRIDVSGFTFNAATTHWSGYVSELNGSEILKRVSTTRVTTTTFDVSALPAATAAKAPIRNDVPPRGVVAETWGNRIAMVQPTRPYSIWFTAYGEVKSLLNGTPDLTVPGADSTSISDLVNEVRIADQKVTALKYHGNVLFAFSEVNGYALVGSAELLDDRAPRDIAKYKQFNEGCTGKYAAASTPYGLAWLTPARKLWLWSGGSELTDIGFDIQPALDQIVAADLDECYLHYYGGNNRKWLLLAANAPDAETGSNTQWRTYVFDFDLGQGNRPGGWYELTDVTSRCFADYVEEGKRYLLAGNNSGGVYQLDTISDPAHLNRSFILGSTYLGATVQDNPAMTIRSGLVTPEGDQPVTAQYLISLVGNHDAPGNTVGTATVTDPTYTAWIDAVNPSSPGAGLTVSLGSAKQSGEKWGWFRADSSADRSGALAKQLLVQAEYAAGADSIGEADGRLTATINAIYKEGITWTQKSEIASE